MTDDNEFTGNLQGIGYKKPPVDTQFGGKRSNKPNRKGRVSNFAQARKLALEVANEQIGEEEAITRLKALFRVMSSSRNPADRMGFLAYAVGKPREELDITSDGKALPPPQVIEVIKTYVKDDESSA